LYGDFYFALFLARRQWVHPPKKALHCIDEQSMFWARAQVECGDCERLAIYIRSCTACSHSCHQDGCFENRIIPRGHWQGRVSHCMSPLLLLPLLPSVYLWNPRSHEISQEWHLSLHIVWAGFIDTLCSTLLLEQECIMQNWTIARLWRRPLVS
jgi:hypothetical protein